jgi:hypothetical protein
MNYLPLFQNALIKTRQSQLLKDTNLGILEKQDPKRLGVKLPKLFGKEMNLRNFPSLLLNLPNITIPQFPLRAKRRFNKTKPTAIFILGLLFCILIFLQHGPSPFSVERLPDFIRFIDLASLTTEVLHGFSVLVSLVFVNGEMILDFLLDNR